MRRLLIIFVAMVFLSGCALSTIRPPKKHVEKKPEPVKKPVIEKVREVFKPEPVEEKEEILPISPKEEEIK